MTQPCKSVQTNCLTVFNDSKKFIGLSDNNDVLILPNPNIIDIKIIDDDNVFVRQLTSNESDNTINNIYPNNESLEEVVHFIRVNDRFVPISRYPLFENHDWQVVKIIDDVVYIMIGGRKLLYSLSKGEIISPSFDEYYVDGSSRNGQSIYVTIYVQKCDESIDVSPSTRIFTWCGEDGNFSHTVIAYTTNGQSILRGCINYPCSISELQAIIDDFISQLPKKDDQYVLDSEEAK